MMELFAWIVNEFQLFLQKDLSKMFDWVLNAPLKVIKVSPIVLNDHRQITLLLLSEFKQIN